ncbi:hypothetical protein FHP89_05400 [Denitromonas ohlonensis]|uniref:Uncharacterized protein n=2 Tax=Denitromonas TaxID=139331 RepID=A0A557R5N1_9RHOO|nr:hypothetical protein FHP90_18575 [Denitromonas ohlonensis]TVO78625.1 hypothetical protein FHP89_05400 [Denitromonas ohlonensis]
MHSRPVQRARRSAPRNPRFTPPRGPCWTAPPVGRVSTRHGRLKPALRAADATPAWLGGMALRAARFAAASR